MAASISCACGYEGPGTAAGDGLICPVCYVSAAALRQWRIPCPAGHVFEVQENWLGRQMICPKCNEPFVPELAGSLESREEARQRQEQDEARLARRWLAIAVGAGVLFVLLLVALAVMSVLRR